MTLTQLSGTRQWTVQETEAALLSTSNVDLSTVSRTSDAGTDGQNHVHACVHPGGQNYIHACVYPDGQNHIHACVHPAESTVELCIQTVTYDTKLSTNSLCEHSRITLSGNALTIQP